MPKIGVLLAGCGVKDGSEIHEAVLSLLFLEQAGAEAICMAPNMEFEMINHLNDQPGGEKRNVLIESARIARGNILDLKKVQAIDLDGLIIPGGAGVVKNLCNYSSKGEYIQVNLEVKRILNELNRADKPVGAICIAPVTLVKALAHKVPEVTIGNDLKISKDIESLGGKHFECSVGMIHVDHSNKLVTTPAYMLGPGIKDIAAGIEKLVNTILDMV